MITFTKGEIKIILFTIQVKSHSGEKKNMPVKFNLFFIHFTHAVKCYTTTLSVTEKKSSRKKAMILKIFSQ